MSDLDKIYDKIRKCLVDLNRDCVLEEIGNALKNGSKAIDIVLGPLSAGMMEVGHLYEEGEYFIAELIEAAEIFKEAMRKLNSFLEKEVSGYRVKNRHRIVIGTVKGDIHDIGKTIIGIMLQAAGHEVHDLGVDVDVEKFVKAIIEYDADILCMSALLTSTARYMETVIKELERRGLRNKVYVLVGGAAVTPEYAKKIGADGYGKDAIETIKLINNLPAK